MTVSAFAIGQAAKQHDSVSILKLTYAKYLIALARPAADHLFLQLTALASRERLPDEIYAR